MCVTVCHGVALFADDSTCSQCIALPYLKYLYLAFAARNQKSIPSPISDTNAKVLL